MKALKIIGGVIICIFAFGIILHFGLRYLLTGRLTLPSDSEYEAIAKSGQPIAQAIEDYRGDHGLLPLVLSDLVPQYLPKLPESGWRLGRPMLSHTAGLPRTYVSYSFTEGGEWRVWGAWVKNHRLNVPGPVMKKPALTGEALFQARLAEYERRIEHHPDTEYFNDRAKEFYEDKIDFLGLANRPELLRAECERDAKIYPKWWFPEMALAESDQLDTNAENRFVAWVHQHATFANYWLLARYYRDRDNTGAALAALAEGATSTFELYPDSGRWSGYGYAFDAARFSYENGKYELTLELCRHCEPEAGYWGGCTLLEYVAASELKLSQFDAAITNTEQVVAIAGREPMQVDVDPKNLTKLLAAAKAHNTNYVYHANDAESSEWSLYVKPSP